MAAAESEGGIEAYDPVAMMLNFAVTNNLLPKDHVQYLALKFELEIATGVRQRGTKMIGEYAPLRKFNESLMHYSSKSAVNLLRGPHQNQSSGGSGGGLSLGLQHLKQTNFFGILSPRSISSGTMEASRKSTGFDYLEVARTLHASMTSPSSSVLVVATDPKQDKAVRCHLFVYSEDGTVLAPGLEATYPDGDVAGLASGVIPFEEISVLREDESLRRTRLSGGLIAKQSVESVLNRIDDNVSGLPHNRFVGSSNGGFEDLRDISEATSEKLRTCFACALHGKNCGESGFCSDCMQNMKVCESCELEGQREWCYAKRHCNQPHCTGTCERLYVTAFTCDHESHQQKFLEFLDKDVTGLRPLGFGDPPHTLKLWRSGLYWWYMYIPDLSGNPWLVTISLLHALREQPDSLGRSEAHDAGLRLSFLRNKDRMDVETIAEMCVMARWIMARDEKLVVYTVYPEKSFWKTNTRDMIHRPVCVATIPFWSMAYVLDRDRACIFGLRPHQPMDVTKITLGGVGNQDGPASVAKFCNPSSFTALGATLLVADSGNSAIRIVDLAQRVPKGMKVFQPTPAVRPAKKARGGSGSLAAVCTSGGEDEPSAKAAVNSQRKKTVQVGTVKDKAGSTLVISGTTAICAALDGTPSAFVLTNGSVSFLSEIEALYEGSDLVCSANFSKVIDLPSEFHPLVGICDAGCHGLIVSARGALLRVSPSDFTFEVISRELKQPKGLTVWNKVFVAIADSASSQIHRLRLSDNSIRPWVGTELDPSKSAQSLDGTKSNATFLRPLSLAVFGMSVFVVEYSKVRLVTSLEPLGRALTVMRQCFEMFQLSSKFKKVPISVDRGLEIIMAMDAFLEECNERHICTSQASTLRINSDSFANQGPACCFSSTVRKSAKISVKSAHRLKVLLERLGMPEEVLLDFCWKHIAAQNKVEGLFGVMKRSGDVPTVGTYQQRRFGHVVEIRKQQDPFRGFHIFFGKGPYYPAHMEVSSALPFPEALATSKANNEDKKKEKRSPAENKKRMGISRDFCARYGKVVRQNGVRAKSKETAGTLPYAIGWDAQREKNAPLPFVNTNADNTSQSEAQTHTLLFQEGSVALFWLGEDADPSVQPGMVGCDVKQSQKSKSLLISQSNIDVTWLTETTLADGNTQLDIADGPVAHSMKEFKGLLNDGCIVPLQGADRCGSNRWIVSDDNMERCRRVVLGGDFDDNDDDDDGNGDEEDAEEDQGANINEAEDPISGEE